MNYYRRKLIESWIVILALLAVASMYQDNAFIACGVFVPVAIYFIMNARVFKHFQRSAPSPKQVIEGSSTIQKWCIAAVGLQILVAFSFLLSGGNLGDYLTGPASLFVAILFPLAPPIFINQTELYRRLGEQA
jgi:hypothetical protein